MLLSECFLYVFVVINVISAHLRCLQGLTGLLQFPVTGAERHGLPGVLSGESI